MGDVTRFLILQVRGSLTAFSQVDSSMEVAGQLRFLAVDS